MLVDNLASLSLCRCRSFEIKSSDYWLFLRVKAFSNSCISDLIQLQLESLKVQTGESCYKYPPNYFLFTRILFSLLGRCIFFLSCFNCQTLHPIILFWYSNAFNNCWYLVRKDLQWPGAKTSSLHFITPQWTQKQHYALLSAGWHKWITTQHLIWCLSRCGTYIFIHSVWHSMDGSAARVLSFADRTEDISIRRSAVYFDFHVYHPSHIHHIPSYE